MAASFQLAVLNQENVTCIVYPAKSWSPHQARPDQNRIRRKKIPTPSAKWIAERQKLDYFPRNLPLSANCHWRAEGGWRREKNQTYCTFSLSSYRLPRSPP